MRPRTRGDFRSSAEPENEMDRSPRFIMYFALWFNVAVVAIGLALQLLGKERDAEPIRIEIVIDDQPDGAR